MNLTATQIAKLTAIVKGEAGYKRAANKQAAEDRFRAALAAKIGDLAADARAENILGAASFDEAADFLRIAMTKAPHTVDLSGAPIHVTPSADDEAAYQQQMEDEEIRDAALAGLKGKRKARAAIEVAAESAPQPEPKKKRESKAKAKAEKPIGAAALARKKAAEDAAKGIIPQKPDMSAPSHKRWLKKLDEVHDLVEAKNLAGLKAHDMEPKSSSRVIICRYRDLVITAIEAGAASGLSA